jgi:ribosome maturation protein Sdo1
VAPRDQYITTQVDPILEKIAAHGIQSLTAEERAILQDARNKMSGR